TIVRFNGTPERHCFAKERNCTKALVSSKHLAPCTHQRTSGIHEHPQGHTPQAHRMWEPPRRRELRIELVTQLPHFPAIGCLPSSGGQKRPPTHPRGPPAPTSIPPPNFDVYSPPTIRRWPPPHTEGGEA